MEQQPTIGFAGQQIRVNLDNCSAVVEDLRADWLPLYLGGVGYAARLLYEELSPGIEPLGPDNKLVLSTGPLTMRKAPGGGSLSLCFKSPLTSGWGEARTGGDFGPVLKRAGFDQVIVEGRSEGPVALIIDDCSVELRPADNLVGKTVSEKREILKNELPSGDFKTLVIGPGGENLVRFAGALFDDRIAGRTGAGAVLGSKNLLAIAVRGSGAVDEADPARFTATIRKVNGILKKHPTTAAFKANGTMGDMPGNDYGGDWPTKNWQSNSWGRGTEVFDTFERHNLIRPYACYRGCVIRCGRKVHVQEGSYQTPEHGGGEYESISCFTAFVMNDNVDAAVHSTWLCNEYGIDTISTGSMIAFAMECVEKGIIPEDDLGDLDLTWGNSEALPKMVRMIALREGVGDLLADGVKRAAARLGEAAAPLAVHVKGLEGPAHDPRSGKALAIGYGTAARGMCHIHPVEAMAWDSGKMDWGLQEYGLTDPETVERWDESGKAADVKLIQDGLILPDIVGICKFFMYAGLTLDHLAEMITALTDIEVDGRGLLQVGERVANLQRLFNIREGFTRRDDLLPERVKAVPSFGKYAQERECSIQDYEKMLSEYYETRGWDPETGYPTDAKLKELGIAR